MALRIKDNVPIGRLREFGFAPGKELAQNRMFQGEFEGAAYSLTWWHKFACDGSEICWNENEIPMVHAWIDTQDGKNLLWFDVAPCCTYHIEMEELDKMVVLTEGPMKADVIHALSGLTVLAVPGVNALQRLEESLTELRAQGVREIKTAFDMDYITNFHVQSAYDKLMALLGRMGFRYGTYVWDSRYKGLDDFIWAKLKANLDRNS